VLEFDRASITFRIFALLAFAYGSGSLGYGQSSVNACLTPNDLTVDCAGEIETPTGQIIHPTMTPIVWTPEKTYTISRQGGFPVSSDSSYLPPPVGRTACSQRGNGLMPQIPRVGTIGQEVAWTLNGRTVPWIWSVAAITPNGQPDWDGHGIFPTHSIYVNDQLQMTIPQAPLAQFVLKDDSYERTNAEIQ
jgi:hypothetical protein